MKSLCNKAYLDQSNDDFNLTFMLIHFFICSNDLVARLGGDEFGILNIETTLENTQKLVNRLLKSLQNVGINAAVCVAAREPSKNLRMAVIEADEKMYQHKRQIKVII